MKSELKLYNFQKIMIKYIDQSLLILTKTILRSSQPDTSEILNKEEIKVNQIFICNSEENNSKINLKKAKMKELKLKFMN